MMGQIDGGPRVDEIMLYDGFLGVLVDKDDPEPRHTCGVIRFWRFP